MSGLELYVREKTTPEQRGLLCLAGMVHVTGLIPRRGDQALPAIGESTRVGELGSVARNNSTLAFVTHGGEIWIGRDTMREIDAFIHESRVKLIAELGLNRNCFVPCSNGERLTHDDLLNRLANPDWMPE